MFDLEQNNKASGEGPAIFNYLEKYIAILTCDHLHLEMNREYCCWHDPMPVELEELLSQLEDIAMAVSNTVNTWLEDNSNSSDEQIGYLISHNNLFDACYYLSRKYQGSETPAEYVKRIDLFLSQIFNEFVRTFGVKVQ
jgi:hypothetical protein